MLIPKCASPGYSQMEGRGLMETVEGERFSLALCVKLSGSIKLNVYFKQFLKVSRTLLHLEQFC